MYRIEDTLSMPWPERAFSRVQSRAVEASQQRQAAFPKCSLFADSTTDLDVAALWRISYARQEHPALGLPDKGSLELGILSHLSWDLLTMHTSEMEFLERVVQEGGSAWLQEPYEMMAAESLSRRLWGYTAPGGDGSFQFVMPARLLETVSRILSGSQMAGMRGYAVNYHLSLMAAMNITGAMLLSDAENRFRTEVVTAIGRYPQLDERALFRRMITASYLIYPLPDGDGMLMHPAVYDPAAFARRVAPLNWDALYTVSDSDDLTELFVPPAEQQAIIRLIGAVAGMTRQDIHPAQLAEDMHVLCKQNAPMSGLREAMSAMLIQKPNPSQMAALAWMRTITPAWMFAPDKEVS